jgi:hypothetical protein
MNVRTLHHRLKDDGCAFNDVINDVRRDLVLRYPDNPSPCRSELAREKLKAPPLQPNAQAPRNQPHLYSVMPEV